jgi:methionine-rich copper-binding protein CopC
VYISGPQRQQLPKLWRLLIVVVLLTLISGFLFPATASAHVELRQASPDRGETVGGAIHSITLQFFDLDLTKPLTAAAFDPSGNELVSQLNSEDQRLVIALVAPITKPGEYLVTFAASGLDGDFTEESFSFRWEEGAPEPKGIDMTEPVGLDTFNYVLLLIGAVLAAFIVHRVITARREMQDARITDGGASWS